MKRVVTFPVAALAAVLLAACGSPAPQVGADDPVLAGLDPALVREVLDNPSARQKLKESGDDQTATKSLAQGMVQNFSDCRQVAALYDQWRRTARTPTRPHFVAAANPVKPANWGPRTSGPRSARRWTAVTPRSSWLS